MSEVETFYPQITQIVCCFELAGGSNITIVENLMSAEVVLAGTALQRGGTNVSQRETRG